MKSENERWNWNFVMVWLYRALVLAEMRLELSDTQSNSSNLAQHTCCALILCYFVVVYFSVFELYGFTLSCISFSFMPFGGRLKFMINFSWTLCWFCARYPLSSFNKILFPIKKKKDGFICVNCSCYYSFLTLSSGWLG